MYIDMHIHAEGSLDSSATVNDYMTKAMELGEEGYRIDGICVSEHDKYKQPSPDPELLEQSGLLVMTTMEESLYYGHALVIFETEEHYKEYIKAKYYIQEDDEKIEMIGSMGGLVIPTHPFRLINSFGTLLGGLQNIDIIESLNGTNSTNENEEALAFMTLHQGRFKGVGGSDAHYVREFGRCLTWFEDDITNNADLIKALKGEKFKAVHMVETKS